MVTFGDCDFTTKATCRNIRICKKKASVFADTYSGSSKAEMLSVVFLTA